MNELVATDLFLLTHRSGFTPSALDAVRQQVRQNVSRIAELGNWPAYIDGEKSLVDRVPSMLEMAPGFDAGLACALDLIPSNRQKLSATLHAAYTEAAVEQVRREMADFSANSETCWWLAANSLCREGSVDVETFASQLHDFDAMRKNPVLCATAANAAFVDMTRNFQVIDGIPFSIKDGGLQGAYIAGYDWGVHYEEAYGLFFIGTFRPSLGLDTFPFSDRKDEAGRPMSGPVHGSHQFVKVSSFKELEAATRFVREHLGSPKK